MYGAAAYRAMPALNRMMVASQSLRFGVASAHAIHDVVAAEPPEGRPAPAPAPAPPPADRSLVVGFDGFALANGKRVLDGTRLRLVPGDRCVIWGPSGSGKSSVVGALVDGAPGLDVELDGRRLAHGLSQVPGRVGVTAPSPLNVPAPLAANLALGRGDAAPVDLDAVRALLDDDASSILDRTGIGANLGRRIHRHMLSGGQAQRVSLIRSLDEHHDIVLLDEPTSALDPRAADALRERIVRTSADRIFVIATHDRDLRSLATVELEIA
jgi:ABC-type transport system involved in cytochrome bd biosynthesis fused ATPase/permease subunit